MLPILTYITAGVAAQSLVSPDQSGHSGHIDFRQAQQFAVMAICDHYEEGGEAHITKEEIRSKEGQIQSLIREAFSEATRLIDENRDAVNYVAKQLLRRGRLDGKEVAAIIEARRPQIPHVTADAPP